VKKLDVDAIRELVQEYGSYSVALYCCITGDVPGFNASQLSTYPRSEFGLLEYYRKVLRDWCAVRRETDNFMPRALTAVFHMTERAKRALRRV